MTDDLPTADESAAGLRALGWLVVDGPYSYGKGPMWIVQCTRGAYTFNTEGRTQQEAYAFCFASGASKRQLRAAMLLTNRILAALLLFSVFLNIGLGSAYFEKRTSGEKQFSIGNDGRTVTLVLGDGRAEPVQLFLTADEARKAARTLDIHAGDVERGYRVD